MGNCSIQPGSPTNRGCRKLNDFSIRFQDRDSEGDDMKALRFRFTGLYLAFALAVALLAPSLHAGSLSSRNKCCPQNFASLNNSWRPPEWIRILRSKKWPGLW